MLTIWDTAGQERYHALNANYYRNSKGAMIVYDVTDIDSFDKVKTWHLELKKYLDTGTPIFILGNKCDILNRTVSEADAEAFAKSVGAEHINTSAKSGVNVKEAFNALATSKDLSANAIRNKCPQQVSGRPHHRETRQLARSHPHRGHVGLQPRRKHATQSEERE